MLGFLIYGLMLAGLCFATCQLTGHVYKTTDRHQQWWRTSRADAIMYQCLGFILLWFLTPLWYEFSGWPYSVPVTFGSNGEVIDHPLGMFTVGRGGKWSNLLYSEIGGIQTPSVTLLTDNPKVRTINHNIAVKITNSEIFYNAKRSRMMIHDGDAEVSVECVMNEIKALVIRRVYDLNNTHSKDFAQFFNPLEPAQQDSYRKMVAEFLDPILTEDGLTVTSARFALQ